jgi:starch synthase
VIFSIYDDDFEDTMHKDFANKIKLEGITSKDLKHYKSPNYVNVIKAAIDFSDGVIIGSPKVNPELISYLRERDKPFLEFQPLDRYVEAYNEFYEEILVNDQVAVD